MSEALSPRSSRRGWLALLQWSALGAGASLIVACGGGGDTSLAGGGGVGAGGTGITGMVNGFGSVIVGGVRYDDSSATVTREDASDDSKLRLGMTVDVSVDDRCTVDATSCVANGFEIHSDLAGEVTASSLTGGVGTLTLMGQTVTVNATTLVHASSGVSASGLATGQIVKVHGRRSATGWVATYIEIKAADDSTVSVLAANGMKFRVAGTLTGTAGSYQIGGEPVDLTGVTVPSGSNVYVRAKITPAATRPTAPNNGWTVTELKSRTSESLAQRSRSRVEVQGYIESVNTVAATADAAEKKVLVIEGLEVVVSSTGVTFDSGISYAALTASATTVVEVKGTINAAGQLVATKVEISDEAEREFHVTASEVSAITSTTFTVTKSNTDPIVVDFDSGDFTGGASSADLGVRILEIKGEINRSTGHLVASRIKRDN